MRLKETNWDAPGGAAEIEVEYPDQPVLDLVNWLRRTPAWRENPSLVELRVQRLNQQLADYRNDVAAGRLTVPEANTPLAEQILHDPEIRQACEAALKAIRALEASKNRKAALEHARNMKRLKRETAEAK